METKVRGLDSRYRTTHRGDRRSSIYRHQRKDSGADPRLQRRSGCFRKLLWFGVRASASKSAGMSLNSATETVSVSAPWSSAGSIGDGYRLAVSGHSSQLTVIGTQNVVTETSFGWLSAVSATVHRTLLPALTPTIDFTAHDRLSSRPLLAWSVHGRAAHFSRHRARRCSRGVTKTAPKGACTAHFSNN